MKIDDPQQAENVKETMSEGQSTEFWVLIMQALDQSIARLEGERDGQEIKELPADQYKMESELLKAKIHYLKHLKELPSTIMAWTQQPDQSTPSFDPYYTASELSELSKKNEV